MADILNSAKLSLDPATTVGTQVRVSDGCYLGAAGGNPVEGFYFARPLAGLYNGFPVYGLAGWSDEAYEDGNAAIVSDDEGHWQILGTDGGTYYQSGDLVQPANPWSVVTWTAPNGDPIAQPTLTHPALQQLAAASTAQGGVFVAGGTQDGVWDVTGTAGDKTAYNFLGVGFNEGADKIVWSIGLLQWSIYVGESLTYYSLSNVATPDLAGMDKIVMAYDGEAYSQRGTSAGKPYYNIIGASDDIDLRVIVWAGVRWRVKDPAGTTIAQSPLVDTATPDLATFDVGAVTNVAWLNASDDTPTNITVTSVTQGELVAGLRIGTDTFVVNGSELGRNKYTDILSIADPVSWNGEVWSPGPLNLGNVALPFQGTPEVTVTKSNPAATENWDQRSASTNANLLTLSPSDGELEPAFDPDITEYTIAAETLVTATTEHEFASVTSPISLLPGVTTITVTAESGTTKTYTVTIPENEGEENYLTDSRGFGPENGFFPHTGFRVDTGFSPSNGF